MLSADTSCHVRHHALISLLQHRVQEKLAFRDRRSQDDIARIFVDPEIHFRQALDGHLIFVDTECDEFDEKVVAARDEVAFDDGVDFLHGRQKPGEVRLSMAPQGDFREDRQRLAQLGDVDASGISGDETLRLGAFDPDEAGAGRQIDPFGKLDVGDSAIDLQFAQDLDIRLVELHAATP